MATRIQTSQVVVWILLLAVVAVGLRNFERGMSSDAPLYASIARNIVQSHNWLDLESGIGDFHPYVEHPHLGYWVLAAVFSVLPAEDWSARIPGCLFYVLTQGLLFFFIRKRFSEKAAVWTVLLLWSWSRYSNFFSNVYLDPGCVFFGLLAVVMMNFRRPALSGLALAFSILYKGLAGMGFVPVLVWVCATRVKEKRVRAAAKFLLAFAAPHFVYWLVLQRSHTPNFLELYWERQMTHRFLELVVITKLISWRGWGELMQDTYYLLLLVPLAFFLSKNRRGLIVPGILLVVYCLLFAKSNLSGEQYWLAVMPWVAWILADGLFARIPWEPERVRKVTGAFAVIAIFWVQYIPFNMHRLPVPEEVKEIQRRSGGPLVLMVPRGDIEFLHASRLAWYANVKVLYHRDKEKPLVVVPSGGLTLHATEFGPAELKANGLCRGPLFKYSELWVSCQAG
ncbi:MAG: glycosyltransferase family 39 protein [Deltaproteobacteria bacterium]|nr:glycosyltransferase family 39 protein [Deltaproteobacteria bacterium]MBI3293318.1 glycosyltransferase family 39 protein [Deltaproteobacteria bacterium]